MREALEQAIQYCIDRGILSEVFKKKRAQVLGMILEEFDKDKYERTIREEGVMIGESRANQLTKVLIEQNRIEDLKKSADDPKYREELYREFHI